MKCRKCGAEISENAKFCENCGAPVEAEVEATPVVNEEAAAATVEETAETATAATEEAVNAAPVAEASFAAKETFSPIPSEPVKKKMPVWAKIAAGVVGVVAVLAVLACCSKVVGNTFRKLFLSPEKYLAYVLKDNFGESIDEILSNYDESIKSVPDLKNVDANVKLEFALGDELSEYLVKEVEENYYASELEWLTWIKKAHLEYGVNSFKGDNEFRFKLGANDVDLISLAFSASKDGDIYFAIPELVKNTVHMKLDADELKMFFETQDKMNALYKEFPTKSELQSISKKYLKAVFNNVKGVERTNDVITVEDISAKATLLTMDLDDELLANIEVDVLTEFLKDKEFEKIWMRAYDAYEELVADSGNTIPNKAESYEGIKKSAQEALDKAKEKVALYKDGQLENSVRATIKVYVDNKGAISGCYIADDEYEGSFILPAKGGRFGVEVVIKDLTGYGDFENFTIEGTGKESTSVITANLKTKIDGEDFFDILINNYDKNISKKGEGSFDVAVTNINFGEDSDSDLEVLKDIIGDTNVGIYYKGVVSKKNAEVTFSFGNETKDLFSIKGTSEIKDGSGDKTLSTENILELDLENEESLVNIINALDESTLANKLREAGANEDLAETIESEFSYLKSLLAYY
ncbi:MAG: zinc ribbon domain-containing protein [Lachnospiraceae bacterium]|nr:zinc ribbon domain-containing protein [Lachnospiraceae bacterium]